MFQVSTSSTWETLTDTISQAELGTALLIKMASWCNSNRERLIQDLIQE